MTFQDRLDHGVSLWRLNGLSLIDATASRAIYHANAPEYGPVILKIHLDRQLLEREAAVLSAADSGYCRFYNADLALGLLLEEQILPGTPLRQEHDLSRRVVKFYDIFERIHITPPEDSGWETYLDWLVRADAFCRNNPVDFRLRENMCRARRIGEKMFAVYPERLLLHGDLHHDNILLDRQGKYRAIDPKGIIGPRIFDIPRFLLNEFSYAGAANQLLHMETCIRLVSQCSGFPVQELRALLFMETVLANVWYMEDGLPLRQQDLRLASYLLHEND